MQSSSWALLDLMWLVCISYLWLCQGTGTSIWENVHFNLANCNCRDCCLFQVLSPRSTDVKLLSVLEGNETPSAILDIGCESLWIHELWTAASNCHIIWMIILYLNTSRSFTKGFSSTEPNIQPSNWLVRMQSSRCSNIFPAFHLVNLELRANYVLQLQLMLLALMQIKEQDYLGTHCCTQIIREIQIYFVSILRLFKNILFRV